MEPLRSQRPNKKVQKKGLLILIGVILSIVFLIKLFSTSSTTTVFQKVFPGLGIKSDDDKVNILLLGNGGGKHEGPYLTDSMMAISFNLKDHKAYFMSLPRDIWVDKQNVKINAVYAYSREKGDGLKTTKQVVGDILGLPIHYGIRLDFSGFTKAVDQVDGLDIVVDKTFDDYVYPIEGKEDDLCGILSEAEKDVNQDEAKALGITVGKHKVLVNSGGQIATDSADPLKALDYFPCRFEHIHFDKGETHMSGAVALVYVRSRHGTNGEGSDFARSRRQQKVIEAFREKVLSLDTLGNPGKIKGLISAFGESFETDIPIDDMVTLYSLSKKVDQRINFVLDDSKRPSLGDVKTLMYNPPYGDYGGAYVLVPTAGNGDFSKVHDYIKKILDGEVIEDEATSSARAGNR
jgi:polyisoprenyl-teichoic acid--peptidoglycan teichoic acid transferase